MAKEYEDGDQTKSQTPKSGLETKTKPQYYMESNKPELSHVACKHSFQAAF